jgi:ribosome-associated protein
VAKRLIEAKTGARTAGRRKATRATKVTARKVAAFASDKKAVDLMVMDLRKVTDMTSFFVLCSGESGPQVRAIADSVLEGVRKAGIEVYHVEGYDSLRWVLIDLIDIVVHIFQPEVRGYYQLERLWGDAPVERIGGDAVSGS